MWILDIIVTLKKEDIYLVKNHLTLRHETYFQHVFSWFGSHIHNRYIQRM